MRKTLWCFLAVILATVLVAGAGMAWADVVSDVVYVSAEPNTSVTGDMSPQAQWFRRNILEKPLFFIFGMAGSAPFRLLAVVPQSANTQVEKARQDGTSQVLAGLYGVQKGINCLVPQVLQEVVQTPLSATLSFGSAFAGKRCDHYYMVPVVDKPHWLARRNWSNPWYFQQMQFGANIVGPVSGTTAHFLGGTAGIFKGTIANLAGVNGAIEGGTLVATNMAEGALEGPKYFNPVTAYDKVWAPKKKK